MEGRVFEPGLRTGGMWTCHDGGQDSKRRQGSRVYRAGLGNGTKCAHGTLRPQGGALIVRPLGLWLIFCRQRRTNLSAPNTKEEGLQCRGIEDREARAETMVQRACGFHMLVAMGKRERHTQRMTGWGDSPLPDELVSPWPQNAPLVTAA